MMLSRPNSASYQGTPAEWNIVSVEAHAHHVQVSQRAHHDAVENVVAGRYVVAAFEGRNVGPRNLVHSLIGIFHWLLRFLAGLNLLDGDFHIYRL